MDSEREAVLKQIGAKREKVRKKEDTAWAPLRELRKTKRSGDL